MSIMLFALMLILEVSGHAAAAGANHWRADVSSTCETVNQGPLECNFEEADICCYCNSTLAKTKLPNYKSVCDPTYYPTSVYYQPLPSGVQCQANEYLADNPCCKRFEAGDRVVILGTYDLTGPWVQIPKRCNVTGAKCSSEWSDSGQVCNSHGWCGFTTGTVIAAASSAALGASYTHCTYRVADFNPRSFISSSVYSEHFLISEVAVSELAADPVTTTTTTATETTGLISSTWRVAMPKYSMLVGLILILGSSRRDP